MDEKFWKQNTKTLLMFNQGDALAEQVDCNIREGKSAEGDDGSTQRWSRVTHPGVWSRGRFWTSVAGCQVSGLWPRSHAGESERGEGAALSRTPRPKCRDEVFCMETEASSSYSLSLSLLMRVHIPQMVTVLFSKQIKRQGERVNNWLHQCAF